MKRFEVGLTLKPVPAAYADIYRARGMEVPIGCTPHSVGALIPLPLRAVHKMWADIHGFFWMPCILCGREYGGHEIADVIPDPTEGPNRYMMICPFCTIDRNAEVTR